MFTVRVRRVSHFYTLKCAHQGPLCTLDAVFSEAHTAAGSTQLTTQKSSQNTNQTMDGRSSHWWANMLEKKVFKCKYNRHKWPSDTFLLFVQFSHVINMWLHCLKQNNCALNNMIALRYKRPGYSWMSRIIPTNQSARCYHIIPCLWRRSEIILI